MATKILSSKKNELVIEIKIPLETSMLDGEQTLEKSLNEAIKSESNFGTLWGFQS
jgi:hypothetical protein